MRNHGGWSIIGAIVRFVDLIQKKRDGRPLSDAEIQAVVDAVTLDSAPDYQVSALLMAIFLNGMTTAERGALTRAMMNSGDVLDFSHLAAAKVDKHSTGGVGDKVSLCLAPAVAACGVVVPMVSGRGLGHTGGTLDKLESIPGLVTRLTTERFIEVVERCGFVMAGQSGDIAPADKKLYALRDVTATVESLPLIASSIMSKKLAEGIGGLVLDVKVGSGAFMKTQAQAVELARALVDLGKAVDVATTAFLTDMDQPLGRAIGNANEMAEALDVLRGGGPDDLVAITRLLGGEMCVLAGVSENHADGEARIQEVLASGAAMEKMRLMVELQGGDPRVCDDSELLPQPRLAGEVWAERDGFVQSFATEALGHAVIGLGGGRNRAEDTVDPAVGIEVLCKRGAPVRRGQPLARVMANSESKLDDGLTAVTEAIVVGEERPADRPLVLEVLR